MPENTGMNAAGSHKDMSAVSRVTSAAIGEGGS